MGLLSGQRHLFLTEGLIGWAGSNRDFKGDPLLGLCVGVINFPVELERDLAVDGNLDRGLPRLLTSRRLSGLENWLSGRVTLGRDLFGQMAISDLKGAVAVKFDREMVVLGGSG